MVLPKRVVEITLEILQMVLLAVKTVDSDSLKCLFCAVADWRLLFLVILVMFGVSP